MAGVIIPLSAPRKATIRMGGGMTQEVASSPSLHD